MYVPECKSEKNGMRIRDIFKVEPLFFKVVIRYRVIQKFLFHGES